VFVSEWKREGIGNITKLPNKSSRKNLAHLFFSSSSKVEEETNFDFAAVCKICIILLLLLLFLSCSLSLPSQLIENVGNGWSFWTVEEVVSSN